MESQFHYRQIYNESSRGHIGRESRRVREENGHVYFGWEREEEGE